MTRPKYATRRTPANPTFGARAAAVASYMGTPFMPWQRLVADVSLEMDPRVPGAWRYPLVVISVPRQSGKTAWLRVITVDRMLSYSRHEIVMTAQTGKDARKRWNQIVAALDARKKPASFKVHSAQGGERLEYLRRGSFIAPFAPTPKSIHGDSLHCVTVDEAWAFDAAAGQALAAAINPTQLTVVDSQIFIVSTRGTGKSAYLNELILKGREAVKDPNATMAYFEWSADEEAHAKDRYSDETLSFHPAIGHTQTAEKIRALAAADGPENWDRSILNLPTAVQAGVVDLAIWDALAGPAPRPAADLVAIGFDVAHDGSQSAIAAAWLTGAGDLAVDVIATDPGRAWLGPALQALQGAGHQVVVCDDSGPTRTATGEMGDTVDGVHTMKPREYATACQLLLDRVRQGTLIHRAHPALRAELAAVETKPLAGATAFDPAKTAVPIAALRAATAAAFGVVHLGAANVIQLY